MKKLTFKEINSLAQCYKLIKTVETGVEAYISLTVQRSLKCLNTVVLESLYLGLNIGTTIYQTHGFRDVI